MNKLKYKKLVFEKVSKNKKLLFNSRKYFSSKIAFNAGRIRDMLNISKTKLTNITINKKINFFFCLLCNK